MPENSVKLEAIDYARVFPWVRLFRAFWIAVDVRKLILAAAALLALSGGWWCVDRLPFAPEHPDEPVIDWPWVRPAVHGVGYSNDPGIVTSMFGPLRTVLQPAFGLFRADTNWSRLAYDLTRFLWVLAVWSFFGGAIGRIAAVQFAKGENIGLWSAVKFSASRFLDYFSAPLLPLGAVGVLWAVSSLGALLGRIPAVGPIIVGVLWGIGLLLAFLMVIVLIGVAVGWPLMFATINVEATDGFDGLSRAYNYVYERPWHYLWFTLVATVYGSVVISFVWLVGNAVVYLAIWCLAWGMGLDAASELVSELPPTVTGWVEWFSGTRDRMNVILSGGWGTVLASLWGGAVALLVMGFVHSYFWTTTTIMYFLLRRNVDGNDFDEVHLAYEEERDELLPLVGTAATTPEATPAEGAPPVDLTP